MYTLNITLVFNNDLVSIVYYHLEIITVGKFQLI